MFARYLPLSLAGLALCPALAAQSPLTDPGLLPRPAHQALPAPTDYDPGPEVDHLAAFRTHNAHLRLMRLQDGGAAEEKPAVKWSSSLTLGATASFGNTNRRTANAAGDAERRSEKHRTTFKLAWDFAEDKDEVTKNWSIDQRRTKGGVKHDYFIAGTKTFLFVSSDGEYDYDQDIELRTTAIAGAGHQFIDEKTLKFSLEAGAGYFREESRVSGAPLNEYPTAKVGSKLDWDLKEGWKLLNEIVAYPSLEDADDVNGSMDTRLQVTISKGMFAQLQWIVDYDNTPVLDGMGQPNDRIDHRVLLSVGWKF